MRHFFAFMLVLVLSAMAQADKIVLFAGGDGKADDHQARNARLVQPFAVDFAPDGSTIYIVEMVKGERLSGVAANGTISTLAGKFGEKGFEGNGEKGPKARFNGMHNLAVGPKGVVFLADTWNNCVRTYRPQGRHRPGLRRHRQEGLRGRRRAGRDGAVRRHLLPRLRSRQEEPLPDRSRQPPHPQGGHGD